MGELSELIERNHVGHRIRCTLCADTDAELRKLREENARLTAPRTPRGVEFSCDDCQQPYAVWFAPNETWNFVMGGADCKGDPGGMLCPRCFTLRAEAAGIVPTAWEVRPERLGEESNNAHVALVYGAKDPDCKANARLIVAAPDLLEAAKYAVIGWNPGTRAALEAVIAKAEGRT